MPSSFNVRRLSFELRSCGKSFTPKRLSREAPWAPFAEHEEGVGEGVRLRVDLEQAKDQRLEERLVNCGALPGLVSFHVLRV